MSRNFLVVNDIWNNFWDLKSKNGSQSLEEKEANLLIPYINHTICTLREDHKFQVIHSPKGTAEYYRKRNPRKRAKKILKKDGCDIRTDYDRNHQKQHNKIKIDYNNDFITNSDEETSSLLNHYGAENIYILGMHVNACIEKLIECLISNNINNQKISLIANCTLPLRYNQNFFSFDNYLEFFREELGIKIIHI